MVSAADRLSAPRLRHETGWPAVFMDVHPALTYRDADAGFLTWHSAWRSTSPIATTRARCSSAPPFATEC
jgi:hypothetical protein